MFKTLFCRFPGIFNKRRHLKNLKKFIKNMKFNIMMKKKQFIIYSNINLLKNVRINLGVDKGSVNSVHED